ncbi:hypothetical protein EON64_10485 [archaeon]|nr:MAG: hypothetical protein EON64_10485 [archaeon]
MTTTNFKLGDEQPTYLSVNRESMAVAEKWGRGGAATSTASNHAATGETSPNALMEAIKKSSIHFGNEKTQYSSVCNSEFVYRGVGGEEYLKRKQDIQDMTYTLRKHNFTLGDERYVRRL